MKSGYCFTARYPEAHVDLQLTARTVNLAKEGFDLAIRHTRGLQP